MSMQDLFDVMSVGTLVATTVPFALIALFFFHLAKRGNRTVEAAQAWPTVAGTILSAEVEGRTSKSANTNSVTTSYYPVVSYEYEVAGTAYRSSRIYAGSEVGTGFRGAMEKRITAFPVGGRVTVYYNPDDPADALLELRAPGSKLFGWVAGCIVLTIVIVVGFMMLVTLSVRSVIP